MRLISRLFFCAVVAATTARATVVNGDLAVNSFAAYAGQTNIVLQATGNIVFTGGTLNLPTLPPGAVNGLLTVQAGNDVVVNDGVTIVAGAGWSVAMVAGTTDFGSNPAVTPGTGNINFPGSGSLVTIDGSISLLAGNNVTVAGGTIGTAGGGDMTITALAGSVSIGMGNLPGQIGTVDGGSISISAGGNVSGIITGTITNITAGGIVTIPAGPGIPINGGCNNHPHNDNGCLHNVQHPDGIFDAGCRSNPFGSRQFAPSYRPELVQFRRH